MRQTFVSLSPRPGVAQNFQLIEPDDPVACVILFAGGPGILGISDDGGKISYSWEINFLVRTRKDFAAHGLVVAVADAPSDRYGKNGLLGGFRNSPEHVTDIQAIIHHLYGLTGLPVWLVGTSRGTESVAYVAIHGKTDIGGVIFTSSVTVTDDQGTSITDLPLDQIRVPAQVLTHNADGCHLTPPKGAQAIADNLTNVPKVDVGYFDGGREPESGPCDPLCEHGFFGIEPSVVARIIDFIRSSMD